MGKPRSGRTEVPLTGAWRFSFFTRLQERKSRASEDSEIFCLCGKLGGQVSFNLRLAANLHLKDGRGLRLEDKLIC